MERHFRIKIELSNYKLLLMALIIGILVGVVSSVFRLVLIQIESFRAHLFLNANPDNFSSYVLPFVFTIGGIIIALWMVRKFAPETSGSGVPEIEGALDGLRPLRWKRVLPVKFIGSLFSLGSGLLLGREGPTIQIGANIARMVKDVFKLPEETHNGLISTGAASGLAGAFNAPLSGIVFVIEEMNEHFKFSFFAVAAIMIGSGASGYTVRFLMGNNPAIDMGILESPNPSEFWLFIVLGVVFGFVGLLYNKLLIIAIDFFKTFTFYPILFISLIIGIPVVLIGLYSPEMIGGGYEVMGDIIHHSSILKMLLLMFGVRFILSIFSYGTGVSGGIFSPMLALGVILGAIFGLTVHYVFPSLDMNVGIYAVAGMAAIFASIVRAPLTGLVLAVEMTSNFELILPLIITTISASVVTTWLGNTPIYSTLLLRKLQNQNN